MPHKHKRKADDEANYNLPPTVRARSLPVGKQSQNIFTSKNTDRPSKKRKTKSSIAGDHDTPKAFARLMSWNDKGRPRKSGLDDGSRPTKKKPKTARPLEKSDDGPDVESHTAPSIPSITSASTKPKILPGESLSDFAARVNQALPLAGLITKTLPGQTKVVQHRQTKTERKLQKGYAAWRERDAQIREKREEALEQALEREEEEAEIYGEDTLREAREGSPGASSGKRQSKRRRRLIGEVDDGANGSRRGDDPFAVLNDKASRQNGLHDVVQAPPQFKTLPKEKFKTVAGGTAIASVQNVPSAGKSLSQREELGQTRMAVIQQYRDIMSRNKG